MYVCMYVCMCVHNRFTIEIYEFTLSLHAFLNHAGIMNAFLLELKHWEDRRQWQENQSRDAYRRHLTAQKWDERQQEMTCVPASECLTSLTL